MDDQRTNREGGSLRFRRLRIALSAFCGLTAVLLLVLFVWSYWWLGAIVIPLSRNRVVALYAIKGTVGAGTSIAQRRRPLTFDALSADRAIEVWRDVNVTPPSPWFGGIIKIKETDLISVYLPTWIVIGVVVAMSVAPWTRWQFTLRTLLIATTLIAVLFGLMVRTEK